VAGRPEVDHESDALTTTRPNYKLTYLQNYAYRFLLSIWPVQLMTYLYNVYEYIRLFQHKANRIN